MTQIIPGTKQGQVEVYYEGDNLYCIYNKAILAFEQWPELILEVFRRELDQDIPAMKSLDHDQIFDETERLFTFIKCRYGAFNKKADIVDGQTDDNTEYFDCGKRGYECPHEGKRCNKIVSVNGVLCRREVQIAKLIAEGHTAKEIGDKVCISEHTVASHRQNILYKIGGRNVNDVTRFACKRGLVGATEEPVAYSSL